MKTFPGDCHKGLNMAILLYNLYYVGFIDKLQDLLGWNKINKEVRGCYYQATRLITFLSDELTRFFAYQFISERSSATKYLYVKDSEFLNYTDI